MADFLSRLVEQSNGRFAGIRPLIPPLFAPAAPLPGPDLTWSYLSMLPATIFPDLAGEEAAFPPEPPEDLALPADLVPERLRQVPLPLSLLRALLPALDALRPEHDALTGETISAETAVYEEESEREAWLTPGHDASIPEDERSDAPREQYRDDVAAPLTSEDHPARSARQPLPLPGALADPSTQQRAAKQADDDARQQSGPAIGNAYPARPVRAGEVIQRRDDLHGTRDSGAAAAPARASMQPGDSTDDGARVEARPASGSASGSYIPSMALPDRTAISLMSAALPDRTESPATPEQPARGVDGPPRRPPDVAALEQLAPITARMQSDTSHHDVSARSVPGRGTIPAPPQPLPPPGASAGEDGRATPLPYRGKQRSDDAIPDSSAAGRRETITNNSYQSQISLSQETFPMPGTTVHDGIRERDGGATHHHIPSVRVVSSAHADKEETPFAPVPVIEQHRIIPLIADAGHEQRQEATTQPSIAAEPPTPIIRVRIGRVEVRAASPEPAPAAKPVRASRPDMTLSEYMQQRKEHLQ